MKKLIITLLCVVYAVSASAKIKYVFYFIGDGMGVNQVNLTETYLAAREGRIGIKPLCMTEFPVVGFVNTYSATNGVTDSAAGGTALATGHKTKNGALGVLKDQQTPITSIAAWAKASGAAVGVATSVSIDHATPGAFYAHVGSRSEYYTIGRQLCESGYDFFAGSDFRKANEHPEEGTLYERAEKAGYIIAKGYADYRKKASKAQKMLLIQSDKANARYNHEELPSAIDQTSADLNLVDITRAGINFLSNCKKDGFFLMVEGGKIDYCCHSNEAAPMIHELINFDNAIRVAYEFYQQHADETLIVVSADHETGGLVMGTGDYNLYSDLLRYQRTSVFEFKKDLNDAFAKHPKKMQNISYYEKLVKEQFGLGQDIKLTDAQQERLTKRYKDAANAVEKNEKVAEAFSALGSTINHLMSEIAHISWASTGHSNGYVPIYAIGEGSDIFQGRIDNIFIAPSIAKIAGWTQP